MQLSSREIVRSILFVVIFWTVTTLLFVGLYQLADAIDITNHVGQMFSK